MVFVEGYPQNIDKYYFKSQFGCFFPRLLEGKDEIIDNAIEAVYTSYYGVKELWSNLDKDIYFTKTRQCYGYLTAWYIADMFPLYTSGVTSMGGIAVKSKSIGGVKIVYEDVDRQSIKRPDNLSHLKTNSLGKQAYIMIKASARMHLLLGGNKL